MDQSLFDFAVVAESGNKRNARVPVRPKRDARVPFVFKVVPLGLAPDRTPRTRETLVLKGQIRQKGRETQGLKVDEIAYRQRDARVAMRAEANLKRDARVPFKTPGVPLVGS